MIVKRFLHFSLEGSIFQKYALDGKFVFADFVKRLT